MLQTNLRVLVAITVWAATLSRDTLAAPDDFEPPPAAEVNERVVVDEAHFDQWVFQGQGDANSVRQRIDSALILRIEVLHRVCEVTETQQQKLVLAAQGDIKRFFEQVEDVREKFRAVQNDPNAFNGIWQDIQPLQQKLARGLFGETSFFAKTLRKTLTTEQAAKYTANLEERRRYRYRVMVEVAFTALENRVPLRHEQHQALVALILDKTSPPHTFDQAAYNVVMHQLSTLPENEVRSLLTERQWELLKRHLGPFREMPVLRQNDIPVE
jgi:hypothetical protein